MKLLRINIENFGKLNGYRWELNDGLNTLCEDNGFGKSTVAAFIKAMLYGLPASTKRNLDKNERKKYVPWQGGVYGGSLEFSCDVGAFRIERFFGAKEANDEFRLFDLATNKPSDAFSPDVGIELFGIDAEGFARSAFLSQNGMDNNEENVSVTAKLTGLLEDVNDMGSYDVAMESIDKRRKLYEVKGGRGRVSNLSTALSNGRRELDRLNELLTQQKRTENELHQTREQIFSTEQELLQLREQLRLADLRQTHLSQQQRLRERLEQAEAQRRRVLSAFRNDELPTDSQLAEMQRKLKEFRIEQGQCEGMRLSPEERSAKERLELRYAKGRPSPRLLSELQDAMRSDAEANAELNAFRQSPPTPYQRRFEATGIPSNGTIEQATQKLEQVKRLESNLQNQTKTRENDAANINLSIVAYAFLILGVLGIAASFLFPVLQIMLLIFGGMTAVAGAILLFIGKRQSYAVQQQKAADRVNEQRQRLLADVGSFLEQYGFLPESKDLGQGLQLLKDSARQAAEDAIRQQEDASHRRELSQRASETRGRLQTLFEACGVSPLPENPQDTLLRIHTDLHEWDMLTQKENALREKSQQRRTELERKQEQISQFLNRLIRKDNNQPEACMEQMEALCRSYAIASETIRQQRQDLADLEAAYRQSGSAELPTDAELKAREQMLTERRDALEQTEARLHRQWSQCTDQTQAIPQLEDELTHLSAELVSAEHNLNVLRQTATFLTDAKEALSTRYLGGMQEHFSRIRQLAEGNNISEANMDTSFAVSVREAGKSRALESFSRGSRDLLQFCARLALTAAMFEEGEKPFLLLDDPFVNLDETHFASVRSLLDKLSEEFQILYFVCHPDRC